MYSPSTPNDYRTFRLSQERERRAKRRRAEVPVNPTPAPIAVLGDSAPQLADLAHWSSSNWLAASSSGGSIDAMDTRYAVDQLADPEAMVKERLHLSAKAGVTSAQQELQLEQEVAHKALVQQGKDMKSKISKLLGKIAEGTAAAQSTQLVFAPSNLAAGGHTLVKSREVPGGDKRSAIRGKPSSTVYFTLSLAQDAAGANELPLDDCDALLGPWVCQALQTECARCGVVRAVKRFVPGSGSCSPVGNDGTSATTAATRNEVRLFVRFDTVASSFKAAEKWDGKPLQEFCNAVGLAMPQDANAHHFASRAVLRAVFYPTAQFDASALDAIVV